VWRLPEVDAEKPILPALVAEQVGDKSAEAETKRVTFRTREQPMGLSDFAGWATAIPGPRLVIVNTVQTAVALARLIARTAGRGKVEHLSTALCPDDRDTSLAVVKARLGPARQDDDWTLVATSCVEAGVDISFRVGCSVRAGLTSLLQSTGRVNRSNEYGGADVWDFRLTPGELVAKNPGVQNAVDIFGRLVPLLAFTLDAEADCHRRAKAWADAEWCWKEALAVYDGITAAELADVRDTGRQDLQHKLDALAKEPRRTGCGLSLGRGGV
jgi:CRISPR-associated endonuclease/helicase Cas3